MSMIRLATKLDGDGKPVEWAEYRSVDLSELSLRMADRMDDELRRTPEIGLSCYAEVVQTLAEARMDAHNFAVTLQQEHPDMDVAEAMTGFIAVRSVLAKAQPWATLSTSEALHRIRPVRNTISVAA